MSRTWTVAHSREGNWVYLYELDRRARLWATLASTLCGCNLPEWLWSIPLGWPRRDPEDGSLENSVAGRIFDAEQWATRQSATAEDRCLVRKIDVDQETVLALAPDWAFLFEGDDA